MISLHRVFNCSHSMSRTRYDQQVIIKILIQYILSNNIIEVLLYVLKTI